MQKKSINSLGQPFLDKSLVEMVDLEEKSPTSNILKDIDFLENKDFVELDSNDRIQFMDILIKDISFLMNQNLMDYSLLLIISELDDNDLYT